MKLALALAALVAMWTSGDVHATVPGRPGLIAFVTDRTVAGGGLVSVRPDGSGRVVVDPSAAGSPVAVSADGAELAWNSAGKLEAADADGSNVRTLGDG